MQFSDLVSLSLELRCELKCVDIFLWFKMRFFFLYLNEINENTDTIIKCLCKLNYQFKQENFSWILKLIFYEFYFSLIQ